MRKVSYWLLAGCLALALTACGDDDNNNGKKPDAGVDSRTDTGGTTDGPLPSDTTPTPDQAPQPDITPDPDQGPVANNVGKACNGDGDCGGGNYFCFQLYGASYAGVCTLECTPDDPDSPLYNEDNCPGQPTNFCHTLPADGFNSASLCFQTCIPTTGQNSCDGPIGCNPIISAYYMEYYGDETFKSLCAAVGCESNQDCYAMGQSCNTATPSCPAGQQCAPYEQGSTEGVCVQAGVCDTTTKLCAPHTAGDATAQVGDPCTHSLECAGNMECIGEFEDDTGAILIRNGYCTVPNCWFGETLAQAACPDGSGCNLGFINGFCQKSCDLNDAATCRGVDGDLLGDYECRNYINVYDNSGPLCDFGFFWPCNVFEPYFGCEIVGDGTFNQTTNQIDGNSTNMSCRNMAGEVLEDPLDSDGICLDDTASGPLPEVE